MDAPIADYYGKPLPGLKTVGPPIGHMLYGIAVRKSDPKLLAKINVALLKMIRDGSLEAIYKKWNIWNHATEVLFKRLARPRSGELAKFTQMVTAHRTWNQRVHDYLRDAGILIREGLPMTIILSVLSMCVAIALGLCLAICRVYTPWPTAALARIYIEAFRGTPLLIQLYLIFFGLPTLGIRLSPFIAGIAGLGLNYAAYEAENFRAGISSIPHAQMEAGLSLGLSRWQVIRHVIVPQALRTCLPPVTNDFISLIKDSSIVSVISMVELTKVYGELAATYYDYIGLGLLTAAIYFLIGLPFVQLSRWLERRLPAM
jgi:polar amino acid transport system substrate-binding protein